MTRLSELILRDRLIRNAAERAKLNGHKIHYQKLCQALSEDWQEFHAIRAGIRVDAEPVFKTP